MSFRPLSAWVQDAVGGVLCMPRSVAQPEDPAEAALLVAVNTWGRRRVESMPVSTNIAELGLHMCGRMELTDVRPGAAATVHATDLHAVPGEPPRLLRRDALLIEVRRPEKGEALFGSTVGLGGYQRGGTWYLVGLQYPDGAVMARWTPQWTERDLAEGVPAETDSPLITDVSAHREWAIEAARFLVVLSLLLDAEGAPLREERERAEVPRLKGQPHPAGGWTTRRLYLDDRRARTGGVPADGHSEVRDRDGLAEEVAVRGHLKRQPHGPGGTLRRWIYVEGYEARRWVGPGPRRTVVS